jgi:CRISPR system Cascade subunit CasD
MKTITLKLTAPLQSCGDTAKYRLRTTAEFPLKSEIIGLVACAFGIKRNDKKIHKLNKLNFAVRIDQPGSILDDFQLIDYGAENSEIAHKHYLQDAVFVVALGSVNNELIEKIDYALHHPKYQLYLGRKCNAPAGPLITEIYDDRSPVEVLQTKPWMASNWFKKRNSKYYVARIIADADGTYNQTGYYLHDNIGSLNSENRFYLYRNVIQVNTKLLNCMSTAEEQEHDIMQEL